MFTIDIKLNHVIKLRRGVFCSSLTRSIQQVSLPFFFIHDFCLIKYLTQNESLGASFVTLVRTLIGINHGSRIER